MRVLLLFLGAIVFLSSCVTNRKVVFMQKDDVGKKNLPHDSIVRTYAIDSFAYKIQPNDLISIRIKSLTDKNFDFFPDFSVQSSGGSIAGGGALTSGELVDNEGYIVFPIIDKVKVAGLTVFQAQDTLQKIADRFLQSPLVRVRLINYRFTLLGEVPAEGTYTFGNNRVTILEAIGQGGGLGELADRSNIKLIRQRGDQVSVQYINLLDENFINSPNFYINQNDVLIVPPLRQRPFRKYFGQNMAVFVSAISILLLTINLLK